MKTKDKHRSWLNLLLAALLSMLQISSALADGVCSNSTIVLPIHVSIDTIASYLEKVAPKEMSGILEDPIKDKFLKLSLESDTLKWRFSLSSIRLIADKNILYANTYLRGSATLKGDLTALRGDVGKILDKVAGSIVSPTIQETVEKINIAVTVSIKPAITDDWRVTPNASANFKIHNADGYFLDSIPYSVKSLLTSEIKKFVDKNVKKFNEAAERDQGIRNQAGEFWSELHRIVQLHDEPEIWLSLKPTYATFARPRISADGVDLAFAVEANTVLTTGDRPSVEVASLPQLRLSDQIPSGRIGVALPLVLDFETVNESVASYLEENPAEILVDSAQLAINRISLSGTDKGTMEATVVFSVYPTGLWDKSLLWIDEVLSFVGLDWNLSNSFRDQVISMNAIPRLDESGSIITISQAKLTDQSSELVRLVANAYEWIKGEAIVDLVEENAIGDLSKHLVVAEKSAQAKLDSVAEDLRKHGVRLDATVLNVSKMAEIQVTKHALLSKLCMSANATVDVKQPGLLTTGD